jgi:predicted hydrolase (HD superfamily)
LGREEAHELLNDWVKNERLRLHMQQVGYLMQQWAIEKENMDQQEALEMGSGRTFTRCRLGSVAP